LVKAWNLTEIELSQNNAASVGGASDRNLFHLFNIIGE